MNPILLPVAFAQGLWVRRKTPRLPDASGPVEGVAIPSNSGLRATAATRTNLILLGESTVAGIGAPTHEHALAGQTAKALAQRTGNAVQWLAVGRSGANAHVAGLQLAPRLAGRRADAVVIALGVNDTIELTRVRRWAWDISQLVNAVRNYLGDARIVVSGPPPLESFPAFPELLGKFLGARSKLLDQALSRLAPTLQNVVHAPMIEGLDEDHFCEDKFHPSVKGYATWGEYLSRFLSDEINR
jgi:lysophospholipase L1-like esterase